MYKPGVTASLPDGIRQQLLDLHEAGLLDADELRQVGVAFMQRLAEPAIHPKPWSCNKNAPPLMRQGV